MHHSLNRKACEDNFGKSSSIVDILAMMQHCACGEREQKMRHTDIYGALL